MKTRHTITLLWISIPVCVLLRTIQILFTIDSSTGFIKQPYRDISILISVVLFAAAAVMSVLAFSTDNFVQKKEGQHPILTTTSVLTGGMFIYEMISSFSSTNDWYDIPLVFLGFFSAIVFAVYGLNQIHPFNFPSFALIIPTLYYIIKLIKLFISTSALALTTENVFLLFTNSVFLWFAFEFASYENGFGDAKKRAKKIFACGVTAIMLGVTTALPKVFLFFANDMQISKGDLSSAILTLTQTLFVLSYIIINFSPDGFKQKKHVSKHSA